MDASDIKTLIAEVNKRMNSTLEHVRHELAGVRTGRASVTILDSVHVEAYGAKMPLNQVAGLPRCSGRSRKRSAHPTWD